MNTPNFSNILDREFEKAERPKPLPVGTYLTIIEGLPRYDKSSKKQTDFVEFTHRFVAAGDDVDTDELAEVGGLTLKDGTPRTIKNTYYLTEDAAWRLDKFLEDLGYDLEEAKAEGITRRQMCEEAANREIYIQLGHEPSQDGRSVFARIKDTASAE